MPLPQFPPSPPTATARQVLKSLDLCPTPYSDSGSYTRENWQIPINYLAYPNDTWGLHYGYPTYTPGYLRVTLQISHGEASTIPQRYIRDTSDTKDWISPKWYLRYQRFSSKVSRLSTDRFNINRLTYWKSNQEREKHQRYQKDTWDTQEIPQRVVRVLQSNLTNTLGWSQNHRVNQSRQKRSLW